MTTYAFSLACAFLLTQPKNGLAPSTESVAVNGRAVDTAGKPIVGAEIQVWRKIQRDGKSVAENDRVAFDGRESLRTDGKGRFQSTATLELGQPMRVIAQADGMLAARSPWIKPGEKKVVELGDIVLRRLRTVTGRVVDRQGNPVPDATVFHAGDAHKSERTTTDAGGRFNLPDVPEGRAFVFAEKFGFRFVGKEIGLATRAESPVEIVLLRKDERAAPLVSQPPVLSPDETRTLTRQVLEPFLKAAAASGSDRDKYFAISSLTAIDALEAFEQIEPMKFSDLPSSPGEQRWKDRTSSYVVWQLVRTQSQKLGDEIRPIVESLQGVDDQAFVYSELAKCTPNADRARKLAYAEQSLFCTRNSKDPTRRATGLARIARMFHETGKSNEAARLVQEAREIAEALSGQKVEEWAALREVAAMLAPTDMPAALGLLDKIQHDNMFAARCGEVAMHLAAKYPPEAERVWLHVGSRASDKVDLLAARDIVKIAYVCYRMAAVDAARARRIAANAHDPVWKIHALGAIALAMAQSDPATARSTLAEIVAEIVAAGERQVSSDHEELETRFSLAAATAWLLPVAEQIDPDLAGELFWRAIALRYSRPTIQWLDDEVETADLHLAAALGRYDRPLARRIIDDARRRMPPLELIGNFTQTFALFGAATTVDPRWAVQLLEEFPEPSVADYGKPKNYTRCWLAQVLADQAAGRWELTGYWNPATEF